MIGDFKTKALQGALFKKFRDHIMGVVLVQMSRPAKVVANMSNRVSKYK